MDKKPFVIMVASQKGGVGKTTVAINLAAALIYQDYKVLLVDTDVDSFSIMEHLGIQGVGNGFKEIVTGKAEIENSLFVYQNIDLAIILGSPADESMTFKPEQLVKFYSQLVKQPYDFIILDTKPGMFPSAIARYLNDVIIVSTPDSPSIASSAKLAAYCEKLKVSRRLVINRSGYSKFEMSKEDTEKMFGDVAFVSIPEDKIVPESLSKQKPVYLIDRGSPFAAAIDQIARVYGLKAGDTDNSSVKAKRRGFFEKIAWWGAKDGNK
jgi:MinD-like ATPase involved in chromosome partitioning or flagellar assembly